MLIYKVLLCDGKTVVWNAMNAARIIGFITCGACLKDQIYYNNHHSEEDMKKNIQDVVSSVSAAEIWPEMMICLFGVMHVCVLKLSGMEHMHVWCHKPLCP